MAALAHETNHLLGFQILVNLITSVISVIMFGYFFSAAMLDKEFYWPYLVLFILPAIRIYLIGHWGQVLEQQVTYRKYGNPEKIIFLIVYAEFSQNFTAVYCT